MEYPIKPRSVNTSNKFLELRLENGEDEEAMLLLLKIMHNTCHLLPIELQLDMLVPFAHLVQLYELHAYTSVVVNSLWFTEPWVKKWLESFFIEPIEIAGLAYCAWAFQNDTLFHDVITALIWNSPSEIKLQEYVWCFSTQFDCK